MQENIKLVLGVFEEKFHQWEKTKSEGLRRELLGNVGSILRTITLGELKWNYLAYQKQLQKGK